MARGYPEYTLVLSDHRGTIFRGEAQQIAEDAAKIELGIRDTIEPELVAGHILIFVSELLSPDLKVKVLSLLELIAERCLNEKDDDIPW